MAPRNPLPGTEGLASQWDLPFSTDRSEEADGHVHGNVQFVRCGLRGRAEGKELLKIRMCFTYDSLQGMRRE